MLLQDVPLLIYYRRRHFTSLYIKLSVKSSHHVKRTDERFDLNLPCSIKVVRGTALQKKKKTVAKVYSIWKRVATIRQVFFQLRATSSQADPGVLHEKARQDPLNRPSSAGLQHDHHSYEQACSHVESQKWLTDNGIYLRPYHLCVVSPTTVCHRWLYKVPTVTTNNVSTGGDEQSGGKIAYLCRK